MLTKRVFTDRSLKHDFSLTSNDCSSSLTSLTLDSKFPSGHMKSEVITPLSEELHKQLTRPVLLRCPQFSSVQPLSHVPPTDCSTPGLPVHHQLLEFTQPMSIESVRPSNYLILCHPLLLLPSIFPSISIFSNQSALCIRSPKYWSFSFSISPSNEHSGLISFRMDWLDLLTVQ